MAVFGRQSITNKAQSHKDLQTLMEYAIHIIDFSIVYGHRTMAQQNGLFKKGRKLKDFCKGDKRSHYIITNVKEVVTYRGFDKPSKHNAFPSLAVDVIPYPNGWSNSEKISELAGVMKAAYYYLKKTGKIKSVMRFGSDWKNPADPAHIEIV